MHRRRYRLSDAASCVDSPPFRTHVAARALGRPRPHRLVADASLHPRSHPGLHRAPLSWFLATSADWGLRHPRASCSPISDSRFTGFPSASSPTTVMSKHQGLAGMPEGFLPAFRTLRRLAPRRQQQHLTTLLASLPFTVRSLARTNKPYALGNRFACRHRRLTMTLMCQDHQPKFGAPRHHRCAACLQTVRSSLHDASMHPIILAVRGISSPPSTRTPRPVSRALPKQTARARAFTPSQHSSRFEAPHSTPSLSRRSPTHTLSTSLWCFVARCRDPMRPNTRCPRLPRCSRCPWCMTVGLSDSRPPRRLETGASLPSRSRAEAPERLTSPGLRSAANLRLALPCGTPWLGACQPLPLDSFDASPCCDASELCASRHPPPLDEVARPPRPRNRPCGLLLDPRFVESSSEEDIPASAYDGSSRRPLAAARRLQPFPGEETVPANRFAGPSGSVASTPCKLAPHPEAILPKGAIHFPVQPEGWLPTRRQGMVSARLRGLHPSTSSLRHSSVKSPCRALLPWVSLSRMPNAFPAEQSLAAPSPSRAFQSEPPPKRDPTQTVRLYGGHRDLAAAASRESTSKNTFNRLPREPLKALFGRFHRSANYPY